MTSVPPSRRLSAPAALLIGVGAAVVGLLPWLVSGMRLPLQNLWATPTLPEDMPLALLPVNQYMVLALFGMLVLPGAIAGLAVRRWSGAARRRSAACAALGLALVLAVAAAQSLTTVLAGLRPGTASTVYVAAITAAVVVSLAVGVAVCLLLGRGGVSAATIGAAAAAVAAGSWLQAFVAVDFSLGLEHPWVAQVLALLGGAVPAALTGLALAWCGWSPARRLGAWAAAVAILWCGGAALESILATASYRVYLGDVEAMAQVAASAFARALAGGWTTAAAAVVIGVGVRLIASRTRRKAAGFRPTDQVPAGESS